MKFGLMFFSSEAQGPDPYRLLLDAARLGDGLGLAAIWTPERHFHAFGGLFPNPAVVGAAVAAVTRRIRIRAGSVIAPLHDVVRLVEEFAVVDNLSCGRVDVSFASGWHPNDFVLQPDNYVRRREVTFAIIEEARRLWRGEALERANGHGRVISVRPFPKPYQPELPVWVTAAGDPETFRAAGQLGANVLTHLVGQTLDALFENVGRYRAARREAKHDAESGTVTLMLHTFLAEDLDTVVRIAGAPFKRYIEHWMSLDQAAHDAGVAPRRGAGTFPAALVEELRELTFRKFLSGLSLMSTPDKCRELIERLRDHGVDEIACLVDFGVPAEAVMDGIKRLGHLVGRD